MIIEKIRSRWKAYCGKFTSEMRKRDFLKYYKNTADPEIRIMVEHIRKTGKFDMINRPLSMDYRELHPEIVFDKEKRLYYIKDESGRIYLPENMVKEAGKDLYQALKKEQDKLSPHCYMDEEDLDFFARGGVKR